MASYRLSRRALQRLKDIKEFSVERFGPDRTQHYLLSLRNRMAYLAKNPHHGVARPELEEGALCFFEGSHVIFYRKTDPEDVLHQSMDVERGFS